MQHHRVDRLAYLRDEVRTMTEQSAPDKDTPQQAFASGRELIEAVRTLREQAQMLKDLGGQLSTAEVLDGDRIDGVKVCGFPRAMLLVMRRRFGTRW